MLMSRIYEGAEGNLPDSASEAAAREVLSVARGCGEGDLLIALISGGGSALLSCPAAGISIEEKRKVLCVCHDRMKLWSHTPVFRWWRVWLGEVQTSKN